MQAKDSWELDTKEKLAAAAAKKDSGNEKFKAGKTAMAIKKYKVRKVTGQGSILCPCTLVLQACGLRSAGWCSAAQLQMRLLRRHAACDVPWRKPAKCSACEPGVLGGLRQSEPVDIWACFLSRVRI